MAIDFTFGGDVATPRALNVHWLNPHLERIHPMHPIQLAG